MATFKEIDPKEIPDNPFSLIGNDWMLITAGTPDRFNTMTAAWGGLGVLWRKQVAFCFIRPTRYTYEFIERSERYTLSFFSRRYRSALNLCGTKSGRDVDKTAETGLTPAFGDGTIYFTQARLVLECRKLYFQDLAPAKFLDATIEEHYPQKDYHRMYVGEIERVLKK
jgi:flavin reductase (DIM6/NTAB) family NADH-FMN oxidoreductase RutF